jgi:hypothetical protein
MFEPTDSGDVKKGSGTKIMGAIQVPAIQVPGRPAACAADGSRALCPAEPLVLASAAAAATGSGVLSSIE